MKIRLIPLLMLSASLLAACALLPPPMVPPYEMPFASPTTGAPTLPPLITPVPPDGDVMPAFIQAARQALAKELSLESENIVVVSINPVNWPNACLGLPADGEMCAQVITPGYRVLLRAGQQVYEVRTGSVPGAVRVAPTGSPPHSAVTDRVRADLAERLSVPLESIRVLEVEEADWPDSCLGISRKGIACAQVIVPGYRVSLEANARIYVYRTNLSGSVFALEPENSVNLPQDGPLLTWESPSGECQSASIGPSSIAFGPCGHPHLTQAWQNVEYQAQYLHFTAALRSFSAETPAGKVQFTGSGLRQASPAEQRAVAEWARMVVADASGAAGGANHGLVLSWHREGGIAGFCDDLLVYRSGVALATSCRGGRSTRLGSAYLNAEQLGTLYRWVDTLSGFTYQHSDQATADGMSVRLLLVSDGQLNADDSAQQAMLQLCQEVFAGVRTR